MTGSGNEVSVRLHHSEALKFNADFSDGRRIDLDSSKEMGRAFTPMELFLVALAGCTSMDVQWIMDRQRQKVEVFSVAIKGNRREEDPKYYENIEIHYTLVGADLRRDAVERAIRLSIDKYCSVLAMVKESVKVNIRYSVKTGMEPMQEYTLSPSLSSIPNP